LSTYLTNSGITLMRDSLTGGTSITADYIGWGTGAGTTSKSDTTLFSESSTGLSMSGENRVLAVRTISGTDSIQWVATLTSNGVKSITNAGNFTGSGSASPGNIMIKGDFTAIPLQTNDRIQFTFVLELT